MPNQRIETCTVCFKPYCRNCSDSDYPDDYCSIQCEEEDEPERVENDSNAEPEE